MEKRKTLKEKCQKCQGTKRAKEKKRGKQKVIGE
jgi:hypothetical protein